MVGGCGRDYDSRMSKEDPIFRTAETADVPAIVALVESAYRGESGLRGWTTESHLLDGRRTDAADVGALIARPGSLVLLAECGDRLMASCHVERQGDAGYFGMFAVDPAEQGSGLGKRVLAEAERIAREEWGCHAMRMTVIVQREELIAWYGRRGYRRTGHYQPFPYGDERFGIPRRDDLRFEVLLKEFAGVIA
jgi:ribosomal protein S18 acetylase RimI-like enzyme